MGWKREEKRGDGIGRRRAGNSDEGMGTWCENRAVGTDRRENGGLKEVLASALQFVIALLTKLCTRRYTNTAITMVHTVVYCLTVYSIRDVAYYFEINALRASLVAHA